MAKLWRSMNLPDDVKEHTKEDRFADIAIYLIRICMETWYKSWRSNIK